MKKNEIRYTLTCNRSRKTYTIRKYDGGKLIAKYRTYPQGESYSETWTENDIKRVLHYSNDYYSII